MHLAVTDAALPPWPRVRRALLKHYLRHRRDLPWRRSRDPYAIWVSEIMLQQTQVDTVIPRYTAFLAQFPTVAALAAATEDTVCEAWAGLGYYRRARFLHAASRQVVQEHGGGLALRRCRPSAFAGDWQVHRRRGGLDCVWRRGAVGRWQRRTGSGAPLCDGARPR